MSWTAILLPAASVLLAMTATWFVRRGRRIDGHPLCRKCGFDLTGKPQDSMRCAECGADLARYRSLRFGHRQSNRVLIGLTSMGLVGAVGWLGVTAYQVGRVVPWIHYAPESWLVNDVEHSDIVKRDAALSELARRILAGELSAEQERELVEKGLACQADWNQPWIEGWGTLIEASLTSGRLTTAQHDQYALNSVQFEAGKVRVMNSSSLRMFVVTSAVRQAPRSTLASGSLLLYFDEPPVRLANHPVHARVDPIAWWTTSSGVFFLPKENTEEAIEAIDLTLDLETVGNKIGAGPHNISVNLILRRQYFDTQLKESRTSDAERRIAITASWSLPPLR